MKPDIPLSEDQVVKKILADIRYNVSFPVSPQSLQKMLLRIELEAYCNFLSSLSPVDDTDFREVYQVLLEYSQMEARSGQASLKGKTLTVGLMLLKAADFIYHPEEYTLDLDYPHPNDTEIEHLGEYIVDMLLIKPVVLMESERRVPL